jgi:quinol-cytochrome oxidoreductase complex cytochrome b subunit
MVAPIVPVDVDAPGGRFRALHWIGVAALACFVLQIVTGLLLALYYRPSAAAAYPSVAVINDEVRLGWVIRSLHAWASELLILLSLLHLIRVYFARAYDGRRGASWASGILAFIIVLAFGFTGTLLPWDQYAYWSIDSSRETIAAIPFLGGTLLNLFWGGWELGEEVLLRFYAFHVAILPWLGAGLLWIHLGSVARSAGGATLSQRLSRSVTATELTVLALMILGLILSLAMLFPRPLLAPADPLAPLPGVQPRWYFLPARQLLRHLPGGTAALTVVALFVLLLAVPLLDRGAAPSRSAQAVRWTLGVSAVVAWLLLALRQYLP